MLYMVIFTISKSSWRLLGVDCEVDGVSSKKKSIFGLFDSVVAEFEGGKKTHLLEKTQIITCF